MGTRFRVGLFFAESSSFDFVYLRPPALDGIAVMIGLVELTCCSGVAAFAVWGLVRLINGPHSVRRVTIHGIAVTAILVGGGAGIIELRFRWQLEAIAVVERHGGDVRIRYTGPKWLYGLQSDRDIVAGSGYGPNWVREWLPAKALRKRFFVVDGVFAQKWKNSLRRSNYSDKRQHTENGEFTNAELAFVARFTRLECLTLDDRPITDDGLKAIRHLRNLQILSLSRTRVTDASAETLVDFGTLQVLNLDGTKFSNAGIAKLKALPQLKRIDASKTDVSATSLEPFHNLNGMRLSNNDRNDLD